MLPSAEGTNCARRGTGKVVARCFSDSRLFLPGGSDPPGGAAGAHELRMTEGALKVAIHRLHRRYRDLARANVRHTLSDPKEVADEIRFLPSSLSAS